MAGVAVAEEVHETTLSPTAKTLYAADIYALQYRLHRCIQAITPLLTTAAPHRTSSYLSSSSSSVKPRRVDTVVARHVRRLGELLREATQLNACLLECAISDERSEILALHDDVHDRAVDAPLHAFYDQQLEMRFRQLRQDMATAQHLLRTRLASTPGLCGLPVNCIGTTPHELRVLTEEGTTQTCYAFTDALTPAAARLPAPITHYVAGGGSTVQPTSPTQSVSSPSSAQGGNSARQKQTAEELHDVPAAASNLLPTTAEDRIMEDIQQAIHQMKDGALQMSAMMAQERSQMQSAAALLSGGVAQTHANMQELDRVSYVGATTRVPWVLSFIPGMPLLWRTVLQPMWVFMKQVLFMVAILAATGCVLLVISVVPKPVRFRGQRKATATTPPFSPPSAAATEGAFQPHPPTDFGGSDINSFEFADTAQHLPETAWQANTEEPQSIFQRGPEQPSQLDHDTVDALQQEQPTQVVPEVVDAQPQEQPTQVVQEVVDAQPQEQPTRVVQETIGEELHEGDDDL